MRMADREEDGALEAITEGHLYHQGGRGAAPGLPALCSSWKEECWGTRWGAYTDLVILVRYWARLAL